LYQPFSAVTGSGVRWKHNILYDARLQIALTFLTILTDFILDVLQMTSSTAWLTLKVNQVSDTMHNNLGEIGLKSLQFYCILFSVAIIQTS
jgi:hypothetical protein